MNTARITHIKRQRRARRVRARISGTAARPRLTVARSLRSLYAQLIDDEKGMTLAAAHSREVKSGKQIKTQVAAHVGTMLAEKAKKAGITAAVFDKGAYRYHGRVKAVVDAVRTGGIKI